MEFVAIDFETTGYERGADNQPWQLGVARVLDGRIVETREWLFGPAAGFGSSAATGPSGAAVANWPEVARSAPSLMEQWPDLHEVLFNRRLVAHNIATERTILTRVAPLTRWGPWVDTLRLAKARYPKLPSYALGDLCEMFGLVPQLEGRTWHDGLYDAVACGQLALHLSR